MKTTQAYYHNSKFWFNKKGWPVEPDYCTFTQCEDKGARFCGCDRNKIHYEEALTTALAEAVEFEDQRRIKAEVIEAVNTQENRTAGNLFTSSSIVGGLYEIVPIEVEVKEIPMRDGFSGQTVGIIQVARIIQPEHKCDYRKNECINEGKMKDGVWVCSNHQQPEQESQEELWKDLEQKVQENQWFAGDLYLYMKTHFKITPLN